MHLSGSPVDETTAAGKMKIPCSRDYPEGLLSAPVGVSLSHDLITEILLRLPVRSLLRFKCVSKSWFSIISDSQFAKLHFDLTLAPTDRLLVKFSAHTEATSIDIDAPSHSDSKDIVFTLPCYEPYSFVRYKGLTVMGSCRGFILLTSSSSTASNLSLFLIWNPSTGQVKRCTRELLACHFVCELGYDSSTGDYLIIVVSQMKVHCFSVSNDSWSYIEDTTVPIFLQSIQAWRGFTFEASFLNDTLHWLLSTYRKILTFDLKERKLSEIPLPHDVIFQGTVYRLKVMGEYLCVHHILREQEVWMMKEYKVQSSWTKLSNVSIPASCCSSDFSTVCFTKNGEIFGIGSFGRVMRLNDKGELLEFRVVKQCDDEKSIFLRPQGMIYRESLLSLP